MSQEDLKFTDLLVGLSPEEVENFQRAYPDGIRLETEFSDIIPAKNLLRIALLGPLSKDNLGIYRNILGEEDYQRFINRIPL